MKNLLFSILHPCIRLLFLLAMFALVGTANAQTNEAEKQSSDNSNSEETQQNSEEEESIKDDEDEDWLEHYYKDPKPDRFVPEIKNWSEDGTLSNQYARPALIAFLSQVIYQNEEKIAEWYGDLSGLTPEEKTVIHTAILYSHSEKAHQLMRSTFGPKIDEQLKNVPNILEMALDKKTTIDMLWGYYYATGSVAPIRRLILCFRFLEAPDQPEGTNIPEGYKPLFKELPEIAFGSLAANIERHPKLLKICETIYEKDDSLIETEKKELYDLLSEFLPEKYKPVNPEDKEA